MKFNEEVTTIILQSIAKGVPYKFSAKKARISEKTLYNWINRGEDDFNKEIQSGFSKFFLDVQETEAAKVEKALDNITNQTNRWQASAWWLARRYPAIYGENLDQIKEFTARLDFLERLTQNNGIANLEPQKNPRI